MNARLEDLMNRWTLLLTLALTACKSDFDLFTNLGPYAVPEECNIDEVPDAAVVAIQSCSQLPGTFNPIVEWEGVPGRHSRSLAAVADLDGDGRPEIIATVTGAAAGSNGDLIALHGDGSGILWQKADTGGYGSGPTIGDVDGDGKVDIFTVRAKGSQLPLANQTYTIVRRDNMGNQVWESAVYDDLDFDYATGIVLSDMDHDGSVEIIAGRVILNEDGTQRGKGAWGKGSWGLHPQAIILPEFAESALPAVADLDLDGVEEVITGNAMYAPDGSTIWHDPDQEDGMIAVANLDDDPEGEFVASSFDTVRAVDTDGTILWGPLQLENANIVSVAAIADLDGDGSPEIVVAGGNQIIALHADGTQLWSNPVVDESGASGASLFDFEGDGVLEVVYFDEKEMVAYDGLTGAVKFFNEEHASGTMMDYPVIADVDADGHAEIIVSHDNFGSAFSVYGDASDSWAPARRLWNQHQYFIDNINDDYTIPVDVAPNFTTHNTWHSAINPLLLAQELKELEVEIVDTCDVNCRGDVFYLLARVANRSEFELPAAVPVTLYGVNGSVRTPLETLRTEAPTPSGLTGEVLTFKPTAADVRLFERLEVTVDDDGFGLGVYRECDEENNTTGVDGPFCAQ